MSLAQIGEFAFVLLSRASNLHLVEVSIIVINGMSFIAVNHSSALAEKMSVAKKISM